MDKNKKHDRIQFLGSCWRHAKYRSFVDNPIEYEVLSSAGEIVDLGGVSCTIASIRHLIDLKRIAGRDKDIS